MQVKTVNSLYETDETAALIDKLLIMFHDKPAPANVGKLAFFFLVISPIFSNLKIF